MLHPLSRPIRIVLWWQVIATAGLAVVAAGFEGMHGAVSAMAGGSVSLIAGTASALVAARGGAKSAGGILVGALAAEGVKIGLILVLLPAVLLAYRGIVMLPVFASFLVTVTIFAMAFFVRET